MKESIIILEVLLTLSNGTLMDESNHWYPLDLTHREPILQTPCVAIRMILFLLLTFCYNHFNMIEFCSVVHEFQSGFKVTERHANVYRLLLVSDACVMDDTLGTCKTKANYLTLTNLVLNDCNHFLGKQNVHQSDKVFHKEHWIMAVKMSEQ